MVKPRHIPLSPPHGARAEPGWLLTLFKPLTNTPEPTLGPCREAGWVLPLFKHLANHREPKTRSVAVNLRVPCPCSIARKNS